MTSTTPNGPQAFQDNDFPILTEEIDFGGRGGSRTPSGGGGTVGQTVERELREILGWRPRPGDHKGFLAALQQAFTVKEVAGHTEVVWNPRSYAVAIQADLGAITGAQASIYTRAKGTVDQVLPLLDGLRPLRVDFDPENVEAIQAIVRSHLTELVAELGIQGGPRVQRVDHLFEFILGRNPQRTGARAPETVGGALGLLRDRLGLRRGRVNTIDEEQNLTNFLVVLDQVVGLAESWDAQRPFFIRGENVEPFLGTQLVLLSRDLEVIAESVHEVEYAMDSVFLGQAERQTLELRFEPGSGEDWPPIFVSELLDWVERFATEEGRRLIDAAGRDGIAAFGPTVKLLQKLVGGAVVGNSTLANEDDLPEAYKRQRVQRALGELAQQLENAFERIKLLIEEPGEDEPVTDVPPRSPGHTS